jgi:hypothetical protein
MNVTKTWTSLPVFAASWAFDRDTGVYSKTGTLTEYTFTVTTLNTIGVESAPVTFTLWNIDGMAVDKSKMAHAISSLGDLTAMAGNINSGANTGDVYVLTKDIALLTTWTPIGTADPVTDVVSATNPNSAASARAFRGSFYGTGHTVSNMVLPGGAVYYNGFFGFTDNALIKDLALVYGGTSPLSLSNSTANNRQFTGIAAGLARNTVIRNVKVSAASAAGLEVSSTATRNSYNYTGGIAGCLVNYDSAGTSGIYNSAASLKVKFSCSPDTSPYVRYLCAGGAAGYVEAAEISGLAVSGGLDVANNAVNNYAGGAVGFAKSTVKKYSLVDVTVSDAIKAVIGNSGPTLNVGGILRAIHGLGYPGNAGRRYTPECALRPGAFLCPCRLWYKLRGRPGLVVP